VVPLPQPDGGLRDDRKNQFRQGDAAAALPVRHERTTAVTAQMDNLDRSIGNLIVPSGLILDQSSSRVLDASTREELELDVFEDDQEAGISGHMR